jgi:hypothetical protein
MFVKRNLEIKTGSAPWARGDLQLAAQSLSPLPHAFEPVTFALGRSVEPDTVIGQSDSHPAALYTNLDHHLGAARVADSVVDRLLAQEVDVAADIDAEPEVLCGLGGVESAHDPSRVEGVAGKAQDAPGEVAETPSVRANAAVFYWVEGSTDGGVHAYARYSVFTGESRGTAPAILGGPWNPTASTAHYMYGGAYSMPDGSLSFLAQWVQENGIHANIVTVPPYSLGVKSAGGVGPFHNFDLPGSDIDHLTFDAPPAGMYDLRANLCSQACDQRKDCVAWTYVRPSTVQGPKGNCWLKNKIPELSSNSCCVSGIVGEGDTDRPGGDYLHFSDVFGKEVTPQYCRLTCFQQARCKAWTYVKPNTIMGSKGVCYLKETVPKPVKNKCCLSGYFTTQVVR